MHMHMPAHPVRPSRCGTRYSLSQLDGAPWQAAAKGCIKIMPHFSVKIA